METIARLKKKIETTKERNGRGDIMENYCVICGTIIPEGRQVCPECEKNEKPKNAMTNKEWLTSDSTELDISFEEVKDIVKDSIDESKNLNDLMERVCRKIYLIGVRDAEVKMYKIQNK